MSDESLAALLRIIGDPKAAEKIKSDRDKLASDRAAFEADKRAADAAYNEREAALVDREAKVSKLHEIEATIDRKSSDLQEAARSFEVTHSMAAHAQREAAIKEREAGLDQRERDLDTRANGLGAREKRVGEREAELESRIERLRAATVRCGEDGMTALSRDVSKPG